MILPGAVAGAQDNPETRAVIAVIDKLFNGMLTRDTAAVRSMFVPEARMLGLTNQGAVRASPVDGWIASIGRANPESPLRERTWGHQVRIDGNIAQAWMEYDFHVGTRFSHCGVDAFDLIKIGAEWKIVSVMDTRRTTGCTEPPADRR